MNSSGKTNSKESKNAVIIVFVYNRPEHTERMLESLMRNPLAAASELFVYADGPRATATAKDLELIERTRSIVKAKQWCGSVHVNASAVNKGLANSVIAGVSEILQKYGKAIILEDDLILSPHFLNYMNEALIMYESEPNVYGISGYTYPASGTLPETFFLKMGCSWGWATWKRAWDDFDDNAGRLYDKILHSGKIKKFNVGGYPYFEMLESQKNGHIDSWGIRFYASLFLKNGLFLFPQQSLVKNEGFDLSGVHCTEDDYFSKVVENDSYVLSKIKAEENRQARKLVERSFASRVHKISLFSRGKNFVRRIIKHV